MTKNFLFTVFCLLGFIFLILSYKNISKTFPISYFDEEWWVGDSYFFQFYINGNYNQDIWDNMESNGQPNITRFIFGAWIYPKYLEAKKQNSDLDYTKYLINNGFYFVSGLDTYTKYRESLAPNFRTLNYADVGYPSDLFKKYGQGIAGNIDLIVHVRQLNIAILTSMMIFLFICIKKLKGFYFGLLFMLFFASNTLILNSALVAHSEAIFLFLFNLSLVFMLKYLSNESKYINLLTFSLFLGLCFSTKLNGVMLYFPYLAIITFGIFHNQQKNIETNFLLKLILPFLVSVIIFFILNPYIWHSPLFNMVGMFAQREATVQYQMTLFPDVALPSLVNRLNFVGKTFYENRYLFIPSNFQGNILNTTIFALFLSGLIIEIRNIRKKIGISGNIMAVFLIVFIITVFYVELAWERYLVHLVIFYVYYLTVGLMYFLDRILKIRRNG